MNPGLYNDSSLELFSSSAHPEFPHLGNYVRKLRRWESDLTTPSLPAPRKLRCCATLLTPTFLFPIVTKIEGRPFEPVTWKMVQN